NAELRDAVRGEVPEALTSRNRAGVDDLAAAALSDHLLRGLLGAHDHTPGVDADDLLEVLLVDLHEVARPVHAGVVEDDVQLAERFDGEANHLLYLSAISDVDPDRLGRSTVRGDRLRDIPGRTGIEIRNDDATALSSDR